MTHPLTSLRGRRASAVAAAAVTVGLALTGCGSGDTASGSGSGDEAGTFGAPADQGLEVFVFDGGYGAEYTDEVVDLYHQSLPDSEVDLNAVQEIATQLQPRFVGGNPPDVIDNSGTGIEVSTLVDNGQLTDLQPLLDAPSFDDPDVTVGETLTDGVVLNGTYDGQFLELRYVNTAYGLWYSQSLMAEHGWEVPTTWDEFLALGEEARAEGIALFAYPGQVVSYAADVFVALAGKQGGVETLKALDNLEPDAWRDPNVLAAFEALAELNAKGLILEGSEGLSHTEAQTSFVLGEALFYPTGSWLENEMKGITPEGFDMALTPVPLLDESTAAMDFSALQVQPGEPFVVPADAKNPKGAFEYLRAMLSKDAAANFSELTGSPTVVKGSLDGVDVSPALATTTEAIENASETDLRVQFRGWYEELRTQWFTTLGDVLTGRATPEEAVETMQAAADAVAADDAVAKHTRD